MIAIEKISELVREKLGENMFLVDLHVSPANVIRVEIDSFDGLTIDQCVDVSRYIESHLNREKEDFELQVTSPGIDRYFKVNQQFRKNIGRELEVITGHNIRYWGKLVEADEKGIGLEITLKEKKGQEKKEQVVTRKLSFDYENIQKAKVVISFK